MSLQGHGINQYLDWFNYVLEQKISLFILLFLLNKNLNLIRIKYEFFLKNLKYISKYFKNGKKSSLLRILKFKIFFKIKYANKK